jgi:hypothetical protein
MTRKIFEQTFNLIVWVSIFGLAIFALVATT